MKAVSVAGPLALLQARVQQQDAEIRDLQSEVMSDGYLSVCNRQTLGICAAELRLYVSVHAWLG
jgi:cell division protein FtsB